MRGSIGKRGGRYYYKVDIGRDAETGKRKTEWRTFKTKKEAEQKLNEALRNLAEGNHVPRTRETVRDFMVEQWLPAIKPTIRHSTWESYDRNVRLHVIPRIGHVFLQQLSAPTLNILYSDLLQGGRADGKGGLSPRTVHYIHTIMHRALKDAGRWQQIVRNVANEADPPRGKGKGSKELRTWTAQELRQFLKSVETDPLYAAYHLAATTGLRRGEVLGLRWQDVDLDRSALAIRQSLIAVKHELEFSEPKTAKGRRSVSLDTSTVAVLRTHKARQAQEKLAAGKQYVDTGLVFAKEFGEPIHPERFSGMFGRRVAWAGLPPIRFHDLRHTHATLALEAGVHPKVVSERLGHATISITLDTYSHAIPALQAEAADTVAKLIFGA